MATHPNHRSGISLGRLADLTNLPLGQVQELIDVGLVDGSVIETAPWNDEPRYRLEVPLGTGVPLPPAYGPATVTIGREELPHLRYLMWCSRKMIDHHGDEIKDGLSRKTMGTRRALDWARDVCDTIIGAPSEDVLD
jgi:hypothetical protein